MCRRAAIAALFLQAVAQASQQTRPPDPGSEPLILRSTSRAAQLDVFVGGRALQPYLRKRRSFTPDATGVVHLTCSQSPDISDEWMDYLARSTGGRAFSGGAVSGIRVQDAQGKMMWGMHGMETDHGVITDALRFAEDDSRYTVLDSNQERASALHPDEVGIDAKVEMAAGTKRIANFFDHRSQDSHANGGWRNRARRHFHTNGRIGEGTGRGRDSPRFVTDRLSRAISNTLTNRSPLSSESSGISFSGC
jgi:hypothetical protein